MRPISCPSYISKRSNIQKANDFFNKYEERILTQVNDILQDTNPFCINKNSKYYLN